MVKKSTLGTICSVKIFWFTKVILLFCFIKISFSLAASYLGIGLSTVCPENKQDIQIFTWEAAFKHNLPFIFVSTAPNPGITKQRDRLLSLLSKVECDIFLHLDKASKPFSYPVPRNSLLEGLEDITWFLWTWVVAGSCFTFITGTSMYGFHISLSFLPPSLLPHCACGCSACDETLNSATTQSV